MEHRGDSLAAVRAPAMVLVAGPHTPVLRLHLRCPSTFSLYASPPRFSCFRLC